MAKDETYASRRADYDNFVQRSQWIAGGAAVVLATTALLFGHGADGMAAASLTSGALAGACAASARVEFAWAASKLDIERRRASSDPDVSLPKTVSPWPYRSQVVMVAGLLLLAVSGIFLIILAWQIASSGLS